MEKLYQVTITPAAKSQGYVRLTIRDCTGHAQIIDLTEAQATTLASDLTTALE